jgi:hypothetical protein
MVRRFLLLAVAGLWLAPLWAADKADTTCGNYGTSVEFLGTPSEAARKALEEQKLVFVLHVSGNFEDPQFT